MNLANRWQNITFAVRPTPQMEFRESIRLNPFGGD
jgi:hypothetical protein